MKKSYWKKVKENLWYFFIYNKKFETYERLTKMWIVHIKKPRTHLNWQIKIHKEGFHPYIFDSFKTKKDLMKGV